ncbi:MAG: 2OG-Fe(II) oxygenase [Sediminibacterium sp.]
MWDKIETLAPGIFVYRNNIKQELDIINRLENVLDDLAPYGEISKNGKPYHWLPAYVGYQQLMPEYRDCNDFKFKKTDIEHDTSEESIKLQGIWQDCYDPQKKAVDDYCQKFNIMELRYWEAFNYIRYRPGQHFMEHHDHGFSYNCTVSLVSYFNDDYEGGGLYFRLQGITYQPKAGDTVIFPSNYMYPHQALPVISGTKYSLVTMLDYSNKYHKPEMYQETGE